MPKKPVRRPPSDRLELSPELVQRATGSSPTFLRLVEAAESVLRRSVGDLIEGRMNLVARIIVARLSFEADE